MFKGPARPQDHKTKDAIAIHTGESLLQTENRQLHIKTIKSLLNLPGKLFDDLYLKPIEKFAEFVQTLPQTRYSIYSHEGGFLDHAIERTARALSLCLTYFFPQEKTLQNASSQQALWIYAVFTAALFTDLGKLAVKYEVTLCDKKGKAIKDWLPYTGTMNTQASYYQYDFIKENRDHLGWLVTPLLARQILTEASADPHSNTHTGGFNWIASDPVVLEAWLRMLSNDPRGTSAYLTVIPIAEAQLIEHHLNNIKAAHMGLPSGLGTGNSLFDAQQPPSTPDSLSAGEAFLRWLRNAIANGTIKTNTAGASIHQVTDGVLLSTAIFKAFVAANPRYGNADSVAAQFTHLLELYIAPLGELHARYSHIQGISASQSNRWLVINNPRLLFESGGPSSALVAAGALTLSDASTLASTLNEPKIKPKLKPT